jgi:hypothetical protein
MPEPDSHLSSVYVEADGLCLLFDCGEGTSHQLLKHGLAGDKIDAIFISHYHPDHISGIYMLMQMLYLQERKKPLRLFLPEQLDFFLQTLRFMYTFREKLGFELLVHPCEESGTVFPEVAAIPTDHLLGYAELVKTANLPNHMRSFAFRIDSASGSLVYTSDIQTTDVVSGILKHCHTAIVDAQHPDLEQILKLKDNSTGRLLLTHGPSEELRNCISGEPYSRFEIAREDHTYHI